MRKATGRLGIPEIRYTGSPENPPPKGTTNSSYAYNFFGSSHDELLELAHYKALDKSLGIKDQSCPVLRLSHKTVW